MREEFAANACPATLIVHEAQRVHVVHGERRSVVGGATLAVAAKRRAEHPPGPRVAPRSLGGATKPAAAASV